MNKKEKQILKTALGESFRIRDDENNLMKAYTHLAEVINHLITEGIKP
ncbi:MAG: hypothetical protein ACXAC8_17610 [Candidatus Hodarchaeales archaeon]|jgi:hypothetical protein